MEENTDKKAEKVKRKRGFRIFRKFMLAIVALVLLSPLLLYIPPLQRSVVGYATEKVSAMTGYDVHVGRFLLKFPFRLSVEDVLVLDQQYDTLVSCQRIALNVRILPLVGGNVVAKNLVAEDASYRMLSADSSMLLTAKLKHFELAKTNVDLKVERIRLSEGSLDGADVFVAMDIRKSKPEPKDTTASARWMVELDRLSMKNTRYGMAMMPTIEKLDAGIARGQIEKVSVNMAANMVKVGYLGIDTMAVNYFYPDSLMAKSYLAGYVPPVDSVPNASSDRPWAIITDSIRVREASALYALKGAVPADGLDMDYLKADDIYIAIDSFYNRGTKIRVPIRRISANERSGVGIRSLSGRFEMDENAITVKGLDLRTLLSQVQLDARIENALFANAPDAKADVSLKSSLSLEEAGKLFPSMRSMLQSVSRVTNAESEVQIHGTGKQLKIEKLDLQVPKILKIASSGTLYEAMSSKNMHGDLKMSGSLTGGSYLKAIMHMDSVMNIPNVKLQGNAAYKDSRLVAAMTAEVDTGEVVLDGRWGIDSRRYEGNLALRSFDVRSLMPSGDIGTVSGKLSVKGSGYDLYKMKTELDAVIGKVDYKHVEYRDMTMQAILDQGNLDASVSSYNDFADLDLTLKGRIAKNRYEMRMEGGVYHFDLEKMKLTEEQFSGGLNLRGFVKVDLDSSRYAGLLRFSEINVDFPTNTLQTDSINIGFYSDTTRTHLRLRNDDLLLRFRTSTGVAQLGNAFTGVASAVDSMFLSQRLAVDALKHKLPQFSLVLNAGSNNVVQNYLSTMGLPFHTLSTKLEKENEDLELHSYVEGLSVSGTAVDTLYFSSYTKTDSLLYSLRVGNRIEDASLFKEALLEGSVSGNQFTALLSQKDADGNKGFELGTNVNLVDSVVRMELFPENPIIAFHEWLINKDNFVSLNLRDKAVQANLKISNNGNHAYIYTDGTDSSHHGINVDLAGIRLGEWLTMSPFAPPIEGTLSSKLKIFYNERATWGNGNINIAELKYGKKRVGDVSFTSKLAYVGETQKIYAQAGLELDGRQVMNIRGYRNDSLPESEYDLKVMIDRFPLAVANAFVPDGLGNVTGFLNGNMTVAGALQKPKIGGYLQFDSTKMSMPMFGAGFDFDTVRIPIDNGIVRFNQFDLVGANGNPLTIDGSVALLAERMHVDLRMSGKDVQVVNSKKNSKAELYGKGYADVAASVAGYVDELDVNASMTVKAGTNLTYVLQSEAMAITESGTDDVVQFVNLNDTSQLAANETVEPRTFGMRINAILTIQPNAVFTVNLSPDGNNRLQIDGDGTLNYSQTYQGDVNTTGRYVINKGYIRYTPPMLSEKLFNFTEGSNIVWTGDLLDPALNIKAVQTIKANVTGENQDSRLVPFDVSLNVGNTMKSLSVTFDLATTGDVTIANELSGMTPEQRSTQAMNLLLYNTYTGTSAKASSNLSGNVAFSFLESSLNKWAANNITGVDVSFGIDQYDKTVDGATSTTTSYSYQVSKSVFDDRFKIVVGGSYSTDASAEDNLAQNLVNDISFEYKLNKTGTAYVKLFRHTEYESILEGEITETGGGFVWKRKIASWKDMFRFVRYLRRSNKKIVQNPLPASDTITARNVEPLKTME